MCVQPATAARQLASFDSIQDSSRNISLKATHLDLDPEQTEAFESLKQLAVEAPILGFFVQGRTMKVETNTSCNANGVIILQKQEVGAWRPVGYCSKPNTPATYAYPIQDRELLAMVDIL
jgi:hypothetical protein